MRKFILATVMLCIAAFSAAAEEFLIEVQPMSQAEFDDLPTIDVSVGPKMTVADCVGLNGLADSALTTVALATGQFVEIGATAGAGAAAGPVSLAWKAAMCAALPAMGVSAEVTRDTVGFGSDIGLGNAAGAVAGAGAAMSLPMGFLVAGARYHQKVNGLDTSPRHQAQWHERETR